MSLILESKAGGDFKPHVEGIHPAVCVDVIDLGLVETEFQGEKRVVQKVRLFFETEQRNDEGRNCLIAKTFTASLHPKAKLADFLGKWRGRPVLPGECIDLARLIGANCTLVISHAQNLAGRTYASIDAVSKPTKRVAPSGQYDPVLARQRIAEWSLRTAAEVKQAAAGQRSEIGGQKSAGNPLAPALAPAGGEGAAGNPNAEARNPREVRNPKSEREGAAALNPVAAAFPQRSGAGDVTFSFPQSGAGAPHSKAPAGAATATADFDPEVGF
jgi:hypothetical protein